MESHLVFDAELTPADRVVLECLADDVRAYTKSQEATATSTSTNPAGKENGSINMSKTSGTATLVSRARPQLNDDSEKVAVLKAKNNPEHPDFEPSVFCTFDLSSLKLPSPVDKYVLQPYVAWARTAVRHETDVIMLTHLIIYATTSIPSILYLFYNFTYVHAIFHVVMQFYYMGTYTLMMHQHIHMRGILHKRFSFIDKAFPFILDPMMGHTWNTYYYHHVKHHHIEGNGPDDMSSTMRFQRDDIFDFAKYVGRFYFFVWAELPLYFLRKNRKSLAAQALASELGTYCFYYAASHIDGRATFFAYMLPLFLLRLGLMIGNWGQHAFVDVEQPDSDYRSSITLIDVASNRFCYNDGYHTSHHLNPMRHWRDHPVSFLEQKKIYAKECALVFHNIDYLMVTFRLMIKDYETLAKCMVPLGDQIELTMEGRIELLKKLTRKFTKEQINEKYPPKK
ncbi:hypothetical protein B0J13DRAFT_468412 [Dactylonectria estremocensis]|uniref:Fatty acid desaturase domain-containing protein n=1 Tax=Dactylonectria estremocensis TaxID=1079267 RepID=A0A9P9JFC2_9HYPO|nr:hypothetical protein B0J13DRAFT_468412 [Dactylonectria estremocensis]